MDTEPRTSPLGWGLQPHHHIGGSLATDSISNRQQTLLLVRATWEFFIFIKKRKKLSKIHLKKVTRDDKSCSSGWVMTDEPETAKTRFDCAGRTSLWSCRLCSCLSVSSIIASLMCSDEGPLDLMLSRKTSVTFILLCWLLFLAVDHLHPPWPRRSSSVPQ